MLASFNDSSFDFVFDNYGSTPSITPGTSVTPGASNAEGSWTQIASSSNITRDCLWLEIMVSAGFTTSTQKDHLLDIGVDPAGGTSYQPIASNLLCGYSAPQTSSGGLRFLIPWLFNAGCSVAVRVQGSAATAGTVVITAKFFGDPCNPEDLDVSTYSETIGAITSSQGVSFTPGTSGAFGSWTSLGTSTSELWWIQTGFQVSSSVINAEQCHIEWGIGDGTTGGTKTIQRRLMNMLSNEQIVEIAGSANLMPHCKRRIPAGTTFYVRGACGAASLSSGTYNANLVGFG